jgi:hypothetical protein
VGTTFSGFVPSEIVDQEPTPVPSFDVKDLVNQWASNALLRQGVVLASGNLIPQQDQTSNCFSSVHDLKLTITYVVPPS